MFDDFEAHLHRLDVRYGSCQVDFFKHLQNKNIHYYFFGTTFMISCHSSPGSAGHVIVLGFPDKRQKGFVHNFLFFVFQTRGIDSIEDFSTLS